MENNNISKYISFEIVKEKSVKGNEYKALYLVIRDSKDNLVYRYLLTFLNTTRYEDLLSLISK